jgi:quinol monooxygenase YgiN
MSISLIVSGIGAVAAAVGVGLLLARSLRAPRADLIAWVVALLGLLISLAAQAIGHLMGFSDITFRLMELGAQLVAPLALLMGLAELLGTTPIARFLSRLYLPALGLIALVILGTDPLTGSFSKAWPSPSTHYQIIPNKLLEWGIGPVSLVMALVFLGLAMVRARNSRQWEGVILAAASAVGAVVVLDIAILTPELSKYGGVSLPMSSVFAPLCLIAAALTWYAGVSVERVPLGALRGSMAPARHPGYDDPDDRDSGHGGRRGDLRHDDLDDDGWDRDAEWRGSDQAGDFDAYDDGSQGVYRGGGLYRDEPPRARAAAVVGEDTGYGYQDEDYHGNGAGDYDSREMDAQFAPDGYDTGSLNAAAAALADGRSPVAGPGAGPGRAPAAGPDGGPGGARPQASREELFGQIAIYTLMEERTSDFDRLAERVVEQVRADEPDTLVFIVHAVPSAPMQRILYEVYRDRAAFDWHRRQPYIAKFEADRRPYVLATNVIELGLQQAKVSPFPSIADLFGEPGYDTSGFERPDYTREYGRSSGAAP